MPDAYPLISCIAAGVLTAAAQALHVGANQVYAPFRGEQMVSRLRENPAVNQGKAACAGEVIENLARLGIVDAVHDEVRVGCEPVGALGTHGQGHRANDRAARGCNSAKVGGRHVRLWQSEAVPVGVDQAIQVSVLDQVGVDHGDLLQPGAREAFEDRPTDAARSDDADVRASQAYLCKEEDRMSGQRLRLARKRAGLSMRALAHAINPSRRRLRRCRPRERAGPARPRRRASPERAS